MYQYLIFGLRDTIIRQPIFPVPDGEHTSDASDVHKYSSIGARLVPSLLSYSY